LHALGAHSGVKNLSPRGAYPPLLEWATRVKSSLKTSKFN
jgi:hypothetical protein